MTRHRILVVTAGMTSVLNSSLELARRLESAGHECVFAGPAKIERAVRSNGHSFMPLTEDDRVRSKAKQDLSIRRPWLVVEVWRARRELDKLDELTRTVCAPGFDLVVIDAEMHTGIVVALANQVPCVLLSVWCSFHRDLSSPPMHVDLDVPTTPRERVNVATQWLRLFADRALAGLRARLHPVAVARRVLAPVNYDTVNRRTLVRLMRRHELSPRRTTSTWNWLRPHTYRGVPTFAAVLEEFDLDVRVPSEWEYVGPLVRQARAEVKMSDRDRQVWQDALSHRASGHQLIYAGVGTRFAHTLSVAQAVADAFADRSETVVIGLGGEADPAEVQSAKNVFVLGYSPQSEVLRSADLAIIHAGIGTINECISSGVPMIVHRYGDVDQPGCAVRVERAGLGRRVDLTSCKPDELATLATEVLEDPAIAAATDRFERLAQRALSGRKLERAVEAVIAASRA